MIQTKPNKLSETFSRFSRACIDAIKGSDGWLKLIGIIILIVVIIGLIFGVFFCALLLFPFLLIWAFNVIAPLVGSSLVLPYSIPLMFAILVFIWLLRSIFNRSKR